MAIVAATEEMTGYGGAAASWTAGIAERRRLAGTMKDRAGAVGWCSEDSRPLGDANYR